MLEEIFSPIRNYRIRSWMRGVENFAKKMKKANSYFILAGKEQKEKKKMAELILSLAKKAKQGKEANIAVVRELLKEFGKEGKELAAKMP